MRYLLVPDSHGAIPEIYEGFKGFEAVISPGDFCKSDDYRNECFRVLRLMKENPKHKENWYDRMGKREARKIVYRALKSGRAVLEYLDKLNVPVYVIPGNNDFFPDKDKWEFLRQNHYKEMISGMKNLKDTHFKIVDTGEHQIIGYGDNSSPEMPHYKQDISIFTKKQLDKKQAEFDETLERLSYLFDKAKKPVIFQAHNVPFKTNLDKIVNPSSSSNGLHYGSLIARKIIEEYQPPVCVSGHMHEHFGKDKIGDTVCINTGYGSKPNVLLELDGNKIKKLKFHGKRM